MKFTPPWSHATRILDQLYLELQESHEISKSWRNTAAPYGLHPSMARMIANGYIPGNRIRKKLGLPEQSKVVSLNGSIPDGSQSLGARQCPNEKCNHQWFIPNSPRRRKCFLCSPYRSKNGLDGKQEPQDLIYDPEL